MKDVISSDKVTQISKLLNCQTEELLFETKICDDYLNVATITFKDNTRAKILIDESRKQYFELKDKEGNIVFVTKN